MEENSAKRRTWHPFRRARQRAKTARNRRTWIWRQGQNVPGEFLRGAAYRLGSGAVTLIILWWETRR